MSAEESSGFLGRYTTGVDYGGTSVALGPAHRFAAYQWGCLPQDSIRGVWHPDSDRCLLLEQELPVCVTCSPTMLALCTMDRDSCPGPPCCAPNQAETFEAAPWGHLCRDDRGIYMRWDARPSWDGEPALETRLEPQKPELDRCDATVACVMEGLCEPDAPRAEHRDMLGDSEPESDGERGADAERATDAARAAKGVKSSDGVQTCSASEYDCVLSLGCAEGRCFARHGVCVADVE